MPAGTQHGFISHKQLAHLYNVASPTMKNELKRIKELQMLPYQRKYSPAQLEIIFKHLGSPYQTND